MSSLGKNGVLLKSGNLYFCFFDGKKAGKLWPRSFCQILLDELRHILFKLIVFFDSYWCLLLISMLRTTEY